MCRGSPRLYGHVIQLFLTWGASLRRNVSRFSMTSLTCHVIQLLLTWGVSLRKNVLRSTVISLAMWSNFSQPEMSVWGEMSRDSPWLHWPCDPKLLHIWGVILRRMSLGSPRPHWPYDPTSPFLMRWFQNEWVKCLHDLVGHVLHPLPEVLVQGQMYQGF